MRTSEEDNTLLSKKERDEKDVPPSPAVFTHSKSVCLWSKVVLVVFMGLIMYCTFGMLFDNLLLVATAGHAHMPAGMGHADAAKEKEKVPQYFQTIPELWAGPTATGRAPFLAQTNAVSFAPTVTFVPNTPLETGMPIVGQYGNESIFQLMGQLSPYFPNPKGFGVAEYPLPPGAKITQVQVRPVFRYVSWASRY